MVFFFFKQKTAYGMRISDWSSDVCSSDLLHHRGRALAVRCADAVRPGITAADHHHMLARSADRAERRGAGFIIAGDALVLLGEEIHREMDARKLPSADLQIPRLFRPAGQHHRSEEHTSELQSLMRISYAVFCLKKKKKITKYKSITYKYINAINNTHNICHI